MGIRIYLLIFLTFCIAECDFEEFGLRIPKNLYLRGHIDYYRQNLTAIPKKFDVGLFVQDCADLLFGRIPQVAGLIKFIVTPLEPFLFAQNVPDRSAFTVWGPTYSSLKEMAIRNNHRYCTFYNYFKILSDFTFF